MGGTDACIGHAAARGPLFGVQGPCVGDWCLVGETRASRWVGPLRRSPPRCPSRGPPTFYAFRWPAGREVGAAVPSSGEPGERTCSLSAAPSPAREPVKAFSTRGAAEGVLLADQVEQLGLELPCSGVSPLQREVGPATVTSGLGLSHARSRRPVDDRPPARFIAVYMLRPSSSQVVGVLSLALSSVPCYLACRR